MNIAKWRPNKFTSIRSGLGMSLTGCFEDEERAKKVAEKYAEMMSPIIPALCAATNQSKSAIKEILTDIVPVLTRLDTSHLTSIYNVSSGTQLSFQDDDEPLRQKGLIDYCYCFSCGCHKRNIVFTKYGLEVFLVLAIADTLSDVYAVGQSYMASLESID